MNKDYREACYKEMAELYESIDIAYMEPLKNYTSFKIGGPADVLVRPKNIEQLQCIIHYVIDKKLPYFLLGNGSNLLVNDQGFRGVIIQLYKQMADVTVEGNTVTAGCGVLLSTLAKHIAGAELEGFEFASGIPGTLGGAIYMNAGAYGGEMKAFVTQVKAMDQQGNIKEYTNEECGFGYRKSIFQTNGECILEATFHFEKGNAEEIAAKLKDFTARRKEKQPLEKPSAGSTFKRPEGYFAGKLIMDAGLRGYSIGGAQVSEKHCGFVINKGNATAQDVIDLIHYVRKKVYELFEVEMMPEVKILGETCLEEVTLNALG